MGANRWRLDGQVALVTGASRGIGLACARELAAFGAEVLMVARDELVLEGARAELAEEFPGRAVRALAADVADREQRLELGRRGALGVREHYTAARMAERTLEVFRAVTDTSSRRALALATA